MTLEYIFDPKTVSSILQRYPSLHQKLGNPAVEGRKAVNFQARKTGREIYRVLSNQHYQHLADLLSTLEYCLKGGFEAPKLLETNVRQDFASSVSELLLAEYFLKQGFSVRGLEEGKGTEAVPDMLVEAAQPVCIEAYSPRDWTGLNDLVEELRIGIVHLDLPWDFHFEVRVELINRFDHEGKPIWFDPWQFSESTETPKQRFTKLVPILSEIETRLGKSKAAFNFTSRDDLQNVLAKLSFEQIRSGDGALPSRSGCGGTPTLTGYAPEIMFDQLVERRVLKKIQKGQAKSTKLDCLSALFVDISRLGYTDEFSHSWYLNKFSQSLEKHLETSEIDIDVVAFYLPEINQHNAIQFPLVFVRPGVTYGVQSMLFGKGVGSLYLDQPRQPGVENPP